MNEPVPTQVPRSLRFFSLIPHGTQYNFIKYFKHFVIFSGLTVGVSLGFLLVRGLNYGVDFRGGTQVHVRFVPPVTSQDVRTSLETVGMGHAVVQSVGELSSGDFLVRVETAELNLKAQELFLQKALPEAKIRYAVDRIYVKYPTPQDPELVRKGINDLKIPELNAESVTLFGKATDNEYLVQFAGVSGKMIHALQESHKDKKVDVLQVTQVGPKVGSELRMQAIAAVLISVLLILIYVWFRFEFEFAPGAALALLHDAVIVLGIFSAFQLDFDLSIVAAVLTIVGFSINDTIVVYDRVRENFRKTRDPDLRKIMNDSINQTLGRTILTSGTVFISSVALMVLGGPITFNFALSFTIGIVVGTYSSVFVALPFTIYFHDYLEKRRVRG